MKNLLICLLFLSSMTVGAQGIWSTGDKGLVPVTYGTVL
jgi:hypothetical protein